MTEQLASKLKKPFKFLHHFGYVIFIISFIIPFIIEKFSRIEIENEYYTYLPLIDAFCCFILVPSNYLDVYEDRNNLQFEFGKSNPTANLGWSLFFGTIFLLVFLLIIFDK